MFFRQYFGGIALACFALGAISACGSPNRDACLAYVTEYNKCYVGEEVDPDERCPASLDSTNADCTGYYNCLIAQTECVGGRLQGDTTVCTGCI